MRATDKTRTAEQQGFEAIGRFSEVGGKPFRPFMDRLFSKRVTSAHLNRDWASDADWARMQQDPIRARLFIYTVLLAFAALLVWAYFAPIDEVTRGTGRVIPSSQLQKVQSFDGGVVQEILIREGQLVEAGQVLMRIDPTRYVATYRENRAQALALRARAERLRDIVEDEGVNEDESSIIGDEELIPLDLAEDDGSDGVTDIEDDVVDPLDAGGVLSGDEEGDDLTELLPPSDDEAQSGAESTDETQKSSEGHSYTGNTHGDAIQQMLDEQPKIDQ